MSEEKLGGRSRSSVGRDILFRGFPAPKKLVVQFFLMWMPSKDGFNSKLRFHMLPYTTGPESNLRIASNGI